MTEIDTIRLARIQNKMSEENLDALVCRLPENIVYLTDYWPHHGFSVAVLPRQGKPMLFLPEVELDYSNLDWTDTMPFGWGLLKDGDLYENYNRLLSKTVQKLGLVGKRVGLEKSFEVVAPTYRTAEPVVPAQPWKDLIDSVFAESTQVDVTNFLQELRAIKSEYELSKLRIANEVAEMALGKTLSKLEPGMSEAKIGAMVEYYIRSEGPGYKGAQLTRALCEVGAGPIDSTKGTLLIPSTTYSAQEGDLIMLELATVVDGYWSDLTYMAVVGEPNERQIEVHNHVLEAQQAAAAYMRAGASFADPDTAAREVLKKAGLDQYFVHITGHAVGLRYHELIPVLMPGAAGTLKTGMVSSVEPGVYIPDFGGIRIEDNIAVGEQGPDFLSTPRKPW